MTKWSKVNCAKSLRQTIFTSHRFERREDLRHADVIWSVASTTRSTWRAYNGRTLVGTGPRCGRKLEITAAA